jgi:hypothetical protein
MAYYKVSTSTQTTYKNKLNARKKAQNKIKQWNYEHFNECNYIYTLIWHLIYKKHKS